MKFYIWYDWFNQQYSFGSWEGYQYKVSSCADQSGIKLIQELVTKKESCEKLVAFMNHSIQRKQSA